MDFVQTAEEKERFLLATVVAGREKEAAALRSLAELEELVCTARAEVVGQILQNRECIHPGTYLGKGKIVEGKDLISRTGATGVVCDDELSPVQMRNLEDALCVKILDRTMVILDIFARHAVTKEGKIQVELAQLRYRATRLTGEGTALSRLGGGIGTRGPGEKKLETDRRVIRERISRLKQELAQVRSAREVSRQKRLTTGIPVVALVGYTNTGKSTLLNALTEASVLTADQLFATLDPTTRNRKLPSGREVLFTDTVGFLSKLPHTLIEAFRSTLEEVQYADLILHVVDASNPDYPRQMQVVYETLQELKAGDKPVLTAFNKMDLADQNLEYKDPGADKTVRICAKDGTGLSQLLEETERLLLKDYVQIQCVIPYRQGGLLSLVRSQGQILEESYEPAGVLVKGRVSSQLKQQVFAALRSS